MELGGVTEVACALGMSKQRVAALRARPSFPQPEAQLAQGPVWDLHKIRRWAETSRQPRGRPHTLSVRRRYGDRYELEGLPDSSEMLHKATDLAVLGSGGRSHAVAVRLIPPPASEAETELIKRRLDLLGSAGHPHVLPIIDHGVDAHAQPYFVTPLPVCRLSRVLADSNGDDFDAVELLRQVALGALHLVQSDTGVGFRIDSSSIVQGASSAWMLAGILPESDSPSTSVLIKEFRVLVGDLGDSQTCLGDEVLVKSLRWIDTRLAKRSLSIDPARFVNLLLEDLRQVTELLSHRVVRSSGRDDHWMLDAVRLGTEAPELLCAALSPLAKTTNPGTKNEHGPATPDVAARILPLLSLAQLEALLHHDPELLRSVISTWSDDLADSVRSSDETHAATGFLVRILELEDDSFVTSCLLGLVSLAGRRTDWYPRSALISLLQNVRDRRRVSLVTEALTMCDSDDLRKALRGTDSSWFHPKVREITAKVAEPEVIDLTTGGRVGTLARSRGRRAAGV